MRLISILPFVLVTAWGRCIQPQGRPNGTKPNHNHTLPTAAEKKFHSSVNLGASILRYIPHNWFKSAERRNITIELKKMLEQEESHVRRLNITIRKTQASLNAVTKEHMTSLKEYMAKYPGNVTVGKMDEARKALDSKIRAHEATIKTISSYLKSTRERDAAAKEKCKTLKQRILREQALLDKQLKMKNELPREPMILPPLPWKTDEWKNLAESEKADKKKKNNVAKPPVIQNAIRGKIQLAPLLRNRSRSRIRRAEPVDKKYSSDLTQWERDQALEALIPKAPEQYRDNLAHNVHGRLGEENPYPYELDDISVEKLFVNWPHSRIKVFLDDGYSDTKNKTMISITSLPIHWHEPQWSNFTKYQRQTIESAVRDKLRRLKMKNQIKNGENLVKMSDKAIKTKEDYIWSLQFQAQNLERIIVTKNYGPVQVSSAFGYGPRVWGENLVNWVGAYRDVIQKEKEKVKELRAAVRSAKARLAELKAKDERLEKVSPPGY